jgi:MoaA/NifB/PqqE/SkfB family radical SAM enzyme
MIFKNSNSNRNNPFREIYDSEEFKTVLQRKNKLRKFPFLIDVELTNHCNLQCIFCGQQVMTRPKGFIEEELLKKVVDECSEFKTPIRFIRWGEPFLHPKIIDFCKYIKSKGLLLHITNNGLAIKESDMKALVELKVDSVVFSFQGATKQQYELLRNNHRYDELKENIFTMVKIRGDKEKPFIHISSTMLDESQEEIDKFVQYWDRVVDSVGTGKTNLSKLSASQIKSFETIGKLELLKKQETIKKYYRPCKEVYQKLSVDWDGKVSCCCGDFDNFLTVGNLSDSFLFDIWNNSRTLKIFRELLDKNMHKSLTLCSRCYHTYDEF